MRLSISCSVILAIGLSGCGGGAQTATDNRTVVQQEPEKAEARKLGAQFATGSEVNLPPLPDNLPDLVGYTGTEWNHEHLPPMRLSADGRVAVAVKSGRMQLRFHLMSPERLTKPFGTVNGTNILQRDPDGEVHQKVMRLDLTLPQVAAGYTTDHISICDVRQTPRACNGMDCYDIVAIASLMPEEDRASTSMLASIPVTVTISDPKTANAKIASVEMTEGKSIKVSASPFAASGLFEPMAVGDGRLLLGRIAKSPLTWTNSKGRVVTGEYDVVYSWYGGGEPCDASRWSELLPITHAPYDADVRSRYDFARQPFRDGAGRVIPEGTETGISYPWIDREAKVLVFATNGATLFKESGGQVTSRFPVRCASCTTAIPAAKALTSIEEGRGLSRGFAVMGAWTQGRMILMDNMLNRADFGLKSAPAAFREVGLYRDKNDDLAYVTVGANRDNNAIAGLQGYVGNTTLFESFTDRFAFSNKFQQRLPRDVTWTVANGVMTDELSFDEFLDRDTILFADMNAVIGLFGSDPTIKYRNGEDGKALLQNTATGGPAYGELTGSARIEPVAAGGRFGKGVYLHDGDTMSFRFGEPVTSGTLYVGAFVKPGSGIQDGLLFTFPRGGNIRVNGDNLIFSIPQANGNFAQRTIQLQPGTIRADAWVHLGFLSERLSDGKTAVSTMINGMAMSYDVFVNSPIEFGVGNFVVGGGVEGWFDEVRVAKALPDVEEMCNYAYGTLAQLEDNVASTNHWSKISNLYPASAHARIQASLNSTGQSSAGNLKKFVCLYKHTNQYGWAPSLPLPNGVARYLRSTLLMGGQTFQATRPRPEARDNLFCQSCHYEDNRVPGLKREDPLAKTDVLMADDKRKQPTQPMRIWSGVTPSGALGSNPARTDTFSIYRYLFP